MYIASSALPCQCQRKYEFRSDILRAYDINMLFMSLYNLLNNRKSKTRALLIAAS